MTDDEIIAEDTAPVAPPGVGAQLRAAREARGLTIDQVAADTRISRRHLQHIEAGEFEALAGKTYAVGFARTYAKTVGLHEGDVAALVRAEMDADPAQGRSSANNTFEPGDPARAPAGRLVWFSLFAVILLLVGIFFAAQQIFAPAAELPSLTEQERAERAAALAAQREAAAAAATPAGSGATAGGAVVFTATGDAWVRFSDASGRVLTERTLAAGESYQVPADAQGVTLTTGRPDLLTVTVGGQPVPPIAEEMTTVADVPVSAQALLARAVPPATGGFGSMVAGAASAGTAAVAPTASPAAASPSRPRTPVRRTAPAAAAPAAAPDPVAEPAPSPAAEPAAEPAPAPAPTL